MILREFRIGNLVRGDLISKVILETCSMKWVEVKTCEGVVLVYLLRNLGRHFVRLYASDGIHHKTKGNLYLGKTVELKPFGVSSKKLGLNFQRDIENFN
ncbi:hypothetical protein Trydic_g9636 [Trypoxylus dichotomus]